MSKNYKVLSKASMAAILATAALVPAAVASAEESVATKIETVVFQDGDRLVKLTIDQYIEAYLSEDLNGKQPVKYISGDNGEVYSLDDYVIASLETDGNSQEAFKILKESNKAVEGLATVDGSIDKDGNVVAEDGTSSTKEDLTKAIEEAKAALEKVEADKKAALEKAIKEAQEVAEKEATAEEIAAAVKALKEAVATAKGEEPAEAVAVESVKANNETSVELTVGKDVTAEDLAGKTVTLTDKDGKAVTATFAGVAEGKATFTLADDAKLVDAATYTVAADWATFAKDTFVAEVGTAYVAKFEQVTTGIAAGAKADVTFKAVDQYGKAIAAPTTLGTGVKLNVNLNGMPLTVGEAGAEATYAAGKVTINKALAEGDNVVIVLTSVVEGKDIAANDFQYEVQKAADPKVTKVTVEPKEATVAAQKAVDLKVAVLDQFNNTMENDVRFVVNGKMVTPGEGQIITSEKGNYKFLSNDPGTFKIEVFSTVDSKIKGEATITVGAADLATLTTGNSVKDGDKELVTAVGERFNNEELIVASLTPNTGAAVDVKDIKLEVEPGKDLTKDDITVKAEKVTVKADDTTKEVIVVKATTKKAGTYTVKASVGEVNASAPITVTTTVNPEVASISDFTFDAKALKVGATNVQAEVVFKNKHGEVLTEKQVNEATPNLSSSKETVTGAVTVVQGTEDNAAKTYVNLAKLAKGTSLVTVQVGSLIKTAQVTVAEAVLTKIDAGKNVTGVVAGDTEDKAKYNVVQFLDQDGVAVDGKGAKLTVRKADAKDDLAEADAKKLATLVKGDLNKDGEFVADPEAKDFVKVLPGAEVEAGTYTVTVAKEVTIDGKTETVKGTFDVTVGAARAAKTVEVKAKASTVTVDGKTTLTIVPKDQYGDIVTDAVGNLEVTGDDFVKAGQATVIEKDGKVVGYEVTVTGAKKGTGTVKVDVKGTKDGKDVVLATASQSIKVDSVSNVITAVEVTADKTEINNSGSGETSKATLTATGKDATGNDVAIADADLTWSIKSVKDADGNLLTVGEKGALTDADGKTVTGTVSIDKKGVLTASKGLTVTVEAEVKTANQKTATTTVKFNAEPATFAKDLALATVAGEKVEGEDALKITFDAEEGADSVEDITLTFTGVDQYGEVIDNVTDVKLSTGDRSVFTVAADTLTISAVDAGTATLYATAGNEKIEIEVTVTEAAAKTINAKALAEAKTKFNEEVAKHQQAEKTPESWAEFKKVLEAEQAKVAKATTAKEVEASTAAVAKAAESLEATKDEPAKSNDVSVSKIKVSEKNATVVEGSDSKKYTVELDKGTELKNLAAKNIVVTAAAGATVAEAVSADNGANWTVVVTAEDGKTTETYTINVTVASA